MRLLNLENDMGVTNAGMSRARPLDNWPGDLNIKAMLQEMQSLSAQITFVGHVYDWQLDCTRFLTEAAEEYETIIEGQQNGSQALREYLAFELSSITGLSRYMQGYKDRTQSQLGVLYSAISQRESQTSITIASSSKKDSIAMMTFTFITALFLPGTFIATLFSMSMFAWQAIANDSGQRVVSTNFWIYWVITVPLTIAVMIGWRLWYKHADRQWKQELPTTLRPGQRKPAALSKESIVN
ncbi:MAG: hypothetical protein M1820_001547 [Bogoriella megaspora]|nr:MAG: hypothetical protein M1820_001547 [Bogoriella megaspora]